MTGLKITARSEHATATCCSVAIAEQILHLNNLTVLLTRKFFQISLLVSINLNREELEKESRKVSLRESTNPYFTTLIVSCITGSC